MSPSSSLSAVLGQLADLAREDGLVESDPVGRAGPSSSLVTRLSRVVDRRDSPQHSQPHVPARA